MSTTIPSGCDACNKSGLSLLLLRPSPIAINGALVPPGTEALQTDTSGLVPGFELNESRYVLRLLRAGYVHVHIPSPPKGMKEWLVYRVTENADLVEQSDPVFAQTPPPPACSNTAHNAAGMRLLHIPQAHKIPVIWIAYSANLWNEKIRKQNRANPDAMMEVDLAGGSTAGSFVPTAPNLRSRVLECALTNLNINKAKDHDFQFNSVASIVDSLADNLKRAAACHPKTAGKERAVVLRDPVGLAAELNALRLRFHELSQQYMLKPEIRQPFEVNRVIETLKGSLIADANERSLDAVSPLRTRTAYLASTPPVGTNWEPLTTEQRAVLVQSATGDSWYSQILLAPYKRVFGNADLGRIVFPDQDVRAASWAKKESDEAWAKMDKYYDEGQRKRWQSTFEADMTRLYLEPLKRYEADWGIALKDGFFLRYFEQHFDDQDRNSRSEHVRSGCSAGSVYTREAWLSYTPEPLTGVLSKTFEAQIDANITKPDAIMLRAVVANQSNLSEQIASEKRDKVYDFMKGLIGEFTQAKTAGGQALSQGTAKAVSWLTNATLGFSAGLVSALAATAAQSAGAAFREVSPGAKSAIDAKMFARLERAQGMALIHRASEEALAAALQGKTPNVPVLMMVHFDPETARQIMKGRGQPVNKKTARQWAKQGRVSIGFITDATTISKLNVDPKIATRELAIQADVVRMQEQAYNLKSAAASGAASGAVLTLPVDKFMDIYEAQRTQIARAPQGMRGWLEQVGKNVKGSSTVAASREAVMSVDGRLAIGSMVVQGLGLLKALADYEKAGTDADKKFDAVLSLADGASGFLGGFFELGAAGWEARLVLTQGAAATETSVMLAGLRGLAYGMGLAGNVVNAWIAYRLSEKLEKDGNVELSKIMQMSGALFGLGAAPLLLAAADQFAKAAIRRGLIAGGGLVTRQLAKIVAIRLGTAAVGLTFPGVGWALTVVAVGQTIYVVVNTPTPFQTWLKSSYFGKPDSGVRKRGSWSEEEADLKKMQADTPVPEEAKRA